MSAYDLKQSIPNKVVQDDGTVTDIFGNVVEEQALGYQSRRSLPNRWLQPDDTYTTLQEIIAGVIDTDIFVIVDELPETGEQNKIYIVPNATETGFDEYMWNGVAWNSIGMIEFDINAYYTKTEVESLIASALSEAKAYADSLVSDLATQVFYWDGNTGANGLEFWNEVWEAQNEAPCIIIYDSYYFHMYKHPLTYSTFHLNSYKAARTQDTPVSSLVGGYQRSISLTYDYNTEKITAVATTETGGTRSVLATHVEYQQAYEPQYPSSPATKKYVDDIVGSNTQIFEYCHNTPGQVPTSFWTKVINVTRGKDTMVVYKEPNKEDYWTAYFEQGYFDNKSSLVLTFTPTKTTCTAQNSNTDIMTNIKRIQILYANWEVTSVTDVSTNNPVTKVLDTDVDYAMPYVPQYAGSPATKQYVDNTNWKLKRYTTNTAYTSGDLLYNVRSTNDLIYLYVVIRNYTSRTLDEDLSLGNILRIGIPNEIYNPANATYDDLFNTAANIMSTSVTNDAATVVYDTREQTDCYNIAYNILTGENPPR